MKIERAHTQRRCHSSPGKLITVHVVQSVYILIKSRRKQNISVSCTKLVVKINSTKLIRSTVSISRLFRFEGTMFNGNFDIVCVECCVERVCTRLKSWEYAKIEITIFSAAFKYTAFSVDMPFYSLLVQLSLLFTRISQEFTVRETKSPDNWYHARKWTRADCLILFINIGMFGAAVFFFFFSLKLGICSASGGIVWKKIRNPIRGPITMFEHTHTHVIWIERLDVIVGCGIVGMFVSQANIEL